MEAEEAYNRGENERVCEILASHPFHKTHHEQLQHLWLAAVYAKGTFVPLLHDNHIVAILRVVW